MSGPIHSSQAGKNENQTPVQDQRCPYTSAKVSRSLGCFLVHVVGPVICFSVLFSQRSAEATLLVAVKCPSPLLATLWSYRSWMPA